MQRTQALPTFGSHAVPPSRCPAEIRPFPCHRHPPPPALSGRLRWINSLLGDPSWYPFSKPCPSPSPPAKPCISCIKHIAIGEGRGRKNPVLDPLRSLPFAIPHPWGVGSIGAGRFVAIPERCLRLLTFLSAVSPHLSGEIRDGAQTSPSTLIQFPAPK